MVKDRVSIPGNLKNYEKPWKDTSFDNESRIAKTPVKVGEESMHFFEGNLIKPLLSTVNLCLGQDPNLMSIPDIHVTFPGYTFWWKLSIPNGKWRHVAICG